MFGTIPPTISLALIYFNDLQPAENSSRTKIRRAKQNTVLALDIGHRKKMAVTYSSENTLCILNSSRKKTHDLEPVGYHTSTSVSQCFTAPLAHKKQINENEKLRPAPPP